jgi:hypothetical protein
MNIPMSMQIPAVNKKILRYRRRSVTVLMLSGLVTPIIDAIESAERIMPVEIKIVWYFGLSNIIVSQALLA